MASTEGICHVSRLSVWVAAWDQPSEDRHWGLTAMDCIGCGSTAVTERPDLTAQGYHRFRCRECGKQFNERSDGVLNRASLPSDIIAFVVFCRLRYRLTLRDLSEIMLLRGFTVSHECIRQWEAKLLPVMGEALRKRRHGTGRRSGQSWYTDETYLKVQGRWCYLYRAIDRDGNLIDTMLSATRDMRAAQRFFRSARSIAGFVPDRVTTDGHNSYPRAIRSTLGLNGRLWNCCGRWLQQKGSVTSRVFRCGWRHCAALSGFRSATCTTQPIAPILWPSDSSPGHRRIPP